MGNRNAVAGIVAVLGLVVSSSSAIGQACSYVNFDTLPSSLSPLPANAFFSGAQPYAADPGVTFTQSGCGTFPVFLLASTQVQAASAPNYLATGDAANCCLEVTFASPQNFAKFWTGMRGPAQPGFIPGALTIRAFDGTNLIAQTTGNALSTSSGPGSIEFVLDSITINTSLPANRCFNRIQICRDPLTLEPFPGSGGWQIFFDQLEFGRDVTPPTLTITSPNDYDCLCEDELRIFGSVCDLDRCNGPVKTSVRIRRDNASPSNWIPLGSVLGNQPNTNCQGIGLIFQANIGSLNLPDGLYVVEVTSESCGGFVVDNRLINIDAAAPVADITCPAPGQVVTTNPPHGPLGILGTAADRCLVDYQLAAVSQFFGVAIATGTSSVSGTLGTIPEDSVLFDGPATLQLLVEDECGNLSQDVVQNVIFDNTYPVVEITSPAPCGTVCDTSAVQVRGSVFDVNIESWKLEVLVPSDPGPNADGWRLIATGQGNVPANGLLGTWDPTDLGPCCFVMRLTAEDRASSCKLPNGPGNTSTTYICGDICNPCIGDFCDGDFAPTNWTTTIVETPSNPSTSAQTLQATGGNPGQFLRVDHQVSGSSTTIWTVSINTSFTYDPDSCAAIASVNYREDNRRVSDGGQAYGPALRQNGKLYVHVSSLAPPMTTAWTTRTFNNLAASAWQQLNPVTGQPDPNLPAPNFATGAIQFGFHRRNSNNSGGAPYTTQCDIDNVCVVINPVCNTIDFNNDGLFPDDNDLIDFLNVLAGGDCN